MKDWAGPPTIVAGRPRHLNVAPARTPGPSVTPDVHAAKVRVSDTYARSRRSKVIRTEANHLVSGRKTPPLEATTSGAAGHGQREHAHGLLWRHAGRRIDPHVRD